MVYEPLHHKYRPQAFAQLVGQHAIATTLCSALQQQRIPPAYLFCGPRGTGKTSSARILAKSLNCIQSEVPTPTPCGQCETCRTITNGSALDVIEIDAASNTGVDNIRELIERSQFAPVQCRYKVYVIDECLTGDTLVQTREGLVRIGDPQIEGQQVLSYNEQSGSWEYKTALRWLDQGTRDVLEIQTSHRKIRCTGKHLIRTNLGWTAARDVKEGMTILSPAPAVAAPSSTNTAPMEDFAALSGAINSKAMSTGKSPIASTISLLKLSFCVPSVNVDVARSLRSPTIFSKKVTVSAASSPTGNDTPLQKGTVAGSSEPRTTWQKQASYQKDGPGGTWMTALSISAHKEALESNSTPRDTPVQKISSSRSGSLAWAIDQQPDPLFANNPANNTITSRWELMQQGVGSQTCSSTPSPQWHTSLETVVSVRLAGSEPVYDIEVEDNHNFVANGLLVHNCHMLSTAAFNALLKTLEEPPERVVFVLATTDPQRVLPTIISRCQRFDFRRIPLEEMVAHLQIIANQEGIKIEPEALRLVAQVSQGGLRDAQSLLDQLSLLPDGVTVERVWDLVGAVPERNLLALVRAIAADDGVQVLEQARHLMDRGREPLVVLQNLASFYRDLLVAKTACDRNDLVAITPSTWAELVEFVQSLELGLILSGQQRLREAEVQVKNTTQPRLWLEVTLLGLLPSTLAAQAVAGSPDGRVLPPRPASQSGGSAAAAVSAPSQPSAVPKARESEVHPAPTSAPDPAGSPSSQPAAAPDTPAPVAAEPPNHAVQPAPDHTPSTNPPRSQDITKADPPASVPAPVPPTAIAPSPSPSAPSVNIREIWQQVIGRLHPLSKALLKEHGQLLDYSGNQATVAISSRNLLKIAQSKVPDIERAFAQVVNQPVRISLTVAADSADASSATGAAADANVNPNPAAAPVHTPIHAAGNAETTSSSSLRDRNGQRDEANGASLQHSGVNTPPPEPRAAANADVPPPDTLSAPSTIAFEPVGAMPPIYTEDAVARASRSFAQFFNGQVVELNEADAMFWSATADLVQSTAAASPSPLPVNGSVNASVSPSINGSGHTSVNAVADAQASQGEHQSIGAEPVRSEISTNEMRDRTSTLTPIPSTSGTSSSSNYDDDDEDDDDIPF